jgi:tetratricopeptide (TPR) repeat protein
MSTENFAAVRAQAEQDLRQGRPAEAVTGLRRLLENVDVLGGTYEQWLAMSLVGYRSLGRRAAAGYVLMTLRRFDEARACFDPAEQTFAWALCAESLGQSRQAADAFRAADTPTLAAMALQRAGDLSDAIAAWRGILVHPRLRGRPYQTALVHFNLARVLRAAGEKAMAQPEEAACQRLLEACADDFETQGERERALDCYGALLRLGRDAGSFENVAEGTLNSIRLLHESEQRLLILQYYDDFLELAAQTGEWHAAAMLAGEAADFSAKFALPFDRHYRQRAMSLWHEAARQNQQAGGPVEVSQNALLAGIDVAASLGDLLMIGRLYGALAELELPPARKARYAALAARHANGPSAAIEAPRSQHWLREDAYPEVWLSDLVEWELAGNPERVLARLLVDSSALITARRAVLRALLIVADPETADPVRGRAELALALGRPMMYETLRPLEELAGDPSALVRAAAVAAAGQTPHRRSLGMVRRALADGDATVRREALQAVRALCFRDALPALVRLYRDDADPEVRQAALESIGKIDTWEAGLFLLELARQDAGRDGQTALGLLKGRQNLAGALARALATETGSVRAALQALVTE